MDCIVECDTLEHMQANERNGFYRTQVAKFKDRSSTTRTASSTKEGRARRLHDGARREGVLTREQARGAQAPAVEQQRPVQDVVVDPVAPGG